MTLSQVISSAAPTDMVILSDVDEIPSRPAIEMAIARPPGEILALDMSFFYYGFNWETPARWDRARAVRASILQSVSPQELRSCPYPDTVIPEAGWHLSYFYKRKDIVERIKAKANSFSHREFASKKYLDDRYLAFCTTTGLSWCSSPRYAVKLRYRDVGIGHPEQVRMEPSGAAIASVRATGTRFAEEAGKRTPCSVYSLAKDTAETATSC